MDESQESPQVHTYRRFMEAAVVGDEATMQECVDAGVFTMLIPGQGRLMLHEVAAYFRRLVGITLDLGQAIVPQTVVEQDGNLAVQYHMAFTLELERRRVELTAVDMVTFDEKGRIVKLDVFYDRADTQLQAFGKTLDPDA